MNTSTRQIKRPALLGLVAVVAVVTTIAASWSLAARASAQRDAHAKGPPAQAQTQPES